MPPLAQFADELNTDLFASDVLPSLLRLGRRLQNLQLDSIALSPWEGAANTTSLGIVASSMACSSKVSMRRRWLR
jgi:hypothetical protein